MKFGKSKYETTVGRVDQLIKDLDEACIEQAGIGADKHEQEVKARYEKEQALEKSMKAHAMSEKLKGIFV